MIKAITDQVFVTPIFDPDMIGHIYVPDIAKERADQGIVKYVGPAVKDVKIGDYIFFSGYTGTLLSIEGEGLLIVLREPFVIAIDDINHEHLKVPGLYFREYIKPTEYSNGKENFIPATYEAVFDLLARAVTEAGLAFKIKTSKPTKEEYDRLTGGV